MNQRIPRIFHVFNFSNNGHPESSAEITAGWLAAHPTWEFREWNEEAIVSILGQHLRTAFPLRELELEVINVAYAAASNFGRQLTWERERSGHVQ